jgi:hypothetical protein
MSAPTFRFDDPTDARRSAAFATTHTIDAERARLARLTARGIGMPLAGLFFWLAVAVLVRELPVRSALFWSFCATGVVFPVGALLTRAFGGDLFAKSETLTPLGLLLNGMQLLFWPVIILVWRIAPEWVPYTMATLFGSHFIGYAWIYRSRGYAVLTLGVSVLLTAAVLVARDPLYTATPLIAAAVYAVAVAILYVEVRDGR